MIRCERLSRPVVFAGNELPWHLPAGDFGSESEQEDAERPLRIVLAHSPDQFHWARRYDADMVLAGHTHGGQIRLPGLGPIFTPSRYGTKYTESVYWQPPTLMHVSRGLSSLTPLRLNCPPEMTRIVLRAVTKGDDAPPVDATQEPTTSAPIDGEASREASPLMQP